MFVIGHVNKEGSIAGPKVLEHMVDCVLYFEGDQHTSYRILRAAKNRFGATNEIGVFEMGDSGLAEVENPSEMLLSGRPEDAPGTCVTCVMEGAVRYWRRSRLWWCLPPRGTPGGPATALTITGRPCCWRCWKSGED